MFIPNSISRIPQLYLCLYAYVDVDAFNLAYMSMSTYMLSFLFFTLCVSVHLRICIHMYTYVFTCMVCMWCICPNRIVWQYIHGYPSLSIYICIYVHTYSYTHVQRGVRVYVHIAGSATGPIPPAPMAVLGSWLRSRPWRRRLRQRRRRSIGI